MNASVAIQILPTVPDDKLIPIVDKVIEYIKSKGLKTFVSPFETTIEGDYDELMEIVKHCQIVACEAGAPSIMTYVKINYDPRGVLTINQKTDKYMDGNSKNKFE
ncbi:thiamine-binding protein [Clostridium sp. BJN0001]|uniref:thiamine-binding protein n=1 Tax=Clostridium sp. BJN0001 TaxID=2930219 RepID=UPI001FD01237|nr:thiamine-binding protein [Clostridium sp. BJN0001]